MNSKIRDLQNSFNQYGQIESGGKFGMVAIWEILIETE